MRLNFYYNYFEYKAFVTNDAQGDEYGCSYEDAGVIGVPFYVRFPLVYIKNKLQKKIIKNNELSQVITVEAKLTKD